MKTIYYKRVIFMICSFCISTFIHAKENNDIKYFCLPVSIITEPYDQSVIKNSSIELSVDVIGTGIISYQWLKDDVLIPDSILSTFKIDSFKKDDEGIYRCIATNSCGVDTSTPAVISLAPSICMVTVRSANRYDNGHNVVVWDKESKISCNLFKVYRESVIGKFDSIGSTDFTRLSVFDDPSVNPKDKAYTYVLTSVNLGGLETIRDTNQRHKTIHLQVTTSKSNGNLLSWNSYVGFPYSYFHIYRSVNSDSFSEVKVIADTVHSWVDDTIVGPTDTVFYYISVKKADACNPTGTAKGGGDIYSQSVSNMEDNRLKSSEISGTEIKELSLSSYPNPFSNSTTISYSLKEFSEITIDVYNIIGVKVSTLIKEKKQAGTYHFKIVASQYDLKPGIYMLKLNAGMQNRTLRLVEIR
jgi:hypothetical protein